MKPAEDVSQQLLGTHVLIRDPDVVQFMAEAVRRDPELGKRLLKLVLDSRQRPDLAIAAANAMTVLVSAGTETFSGMDLSRVRIPGADLSGGTFHKTNFSGADLTGVNFRSCYLVEAVFDQAIMKEVQFGESPAFLGHESYVNSVAFSPDGKFVASGSYDTSIKIWEASTGECVETRATLPEWAQNHRGDRVVSPDGKLEASRSGSSVVLSSTDGGRVVHSMGFRLEMKGVSFKNCVQLSELNLKLLEQKSAGE